MTRLGSILVMVVILGGCSQQDWRNTRDSTLGLFGFKQRNIAVRQIEPKQPAPAEPARKEEDEPVPVAAPRTPVQTEQVAPPAGGRAARRS